MEENRAKRTKKAKKKKFAWIKWAVLAVVFLIFAGVGGYAFSILKEYNYNPLDETDLGISSTEESFYDENDESITNIALFGVDQRYEQEQVHSDSIMILTVDKKHGKIKLSSIMRDTYVAIEGYGNTKITQAYFYGGPQLAVKTLNQNFNLDITDYATVNFEQMANIIDAVGGVEIEISEAERKNANKSIKEQAKKSNLPLDYIEKPGKQLLNGTQAVAYARIRYVGNADFERTDRQRIVMRKLFDKALDTDPLAYPEVARKLLPSVTTSLDFGDIMNLAGILMTGKDITMEELRIPRNEHLVGDGIIYDRHNMQCLDVNMEKTIEMLHAFIYDDIHPDAPPVESSDESTEVSE